jgi:hypothetical protein
VKAEQTGVFKHLHRIYETIPSRRATLKLLGDDGPFLVISTFVLLAIFWIIAEIIFNLFVAVLMAPAGRWGGLCREGIGGYDGE